MIPGGRCLVLRCYFLAAIFTLPARNLFYRKITSYGHRDCWTTMVINCSDQIRRYIDLPPHSEPPVFLARITHLAINHVLLWDIRGFTSAIFFSSLFPTGQSTWCTELMWILCLWVFHRLSKLGLKHLCGLTCGPQFWTGMVSTHFSLLLLSTAMSPGNNTKGSQRKGLNGVQGKLSWLGS